MIINTHISIRDVVSRLPAIDARYAVSADNLAKAISHVGVSSITRPPDWEIDGDAELLMRKMLYNTACAIAKHEFPTDNVKFEARILELFNSVAKQPYPI
jgi:hypothetical protein